MLKETTAQPKSRLEKITEKHPEKFANETEEEKRLFLNKYTYIYTGCPKLTDGF